MPPIPITQNTYAAFFGKNRIVDLQKMSFLYFFSGKITRQTFIYMGLHLLIPSPSFFSTEAVDNSVHNMYIPPSKPDKSGVFPSSRKKTAQ